MRSRGVKREAVELLLWMWIVAAWSFAHAAPVEIRKQGPVSIRHLADDTYLLDFGKVAFGNLLLHSKQASGRPLVVRFGEAMRDGRIDQTPPGAVRFSQVELSLPAGEQVVAPPVDTRNTTFPAVLTPNEWGVLTPFRWVELKGWPGELRSGDVQRRIAIDPTWKEDAASFHSSDPMLDRVWQLCHDSIGATTFAGVFVDGDRERIAYEADAYLTQLGYYAGDPDPRMPRDTFDRLMQMPTWPTEWAPHMVMMAYADWMQTGDKTWLAQHYEALKPKTLIDRDGADKLVHSTPAQIRRGDLVDWPVGERDSYVFTPVNTVVNAFSLHAIMLMRELALALGKQADADDFARRAKDTEAAFQQHLFDGKTGLYLDGEGTDHSSSHANLFPLAFGLVPQADRPHVARWLAERGMRPSVYAAQYLLEGLFQNGESAAALSLMTAPGDRSWRHMVDSGATVTWEAWDQKYKPNQDWNHAWGAAPANLLPRFVLGVQAASPGWQQAGIAPHTGGLRYAGGAVPTPRGTIRIEWKQESRFRMSLSLPAGMQAKVRLPFLPGSHGVWKNGMRVSAHRHDLWWVLDSPVQGILHVQVR